MEVTSVVMVRSEALGFLAYKKRGEFFGCSGTVYTHEIKKIEAYNDSGHCTTYVGHNIQKHTAGPGQQGPFFLAGDSFLCSRHQTSLLTNPIRIFIR